MNSSFLLSVNLSLPIIIDEKFSSRIDHNVNFVYLEFANQLAEFSTVYEHQQYIGLLEKLQKFVKK